MTDLIQPIDLKALRSQILRAIKHCEDLQFSPQHQKAQLLMERLLVSDFQSVLEFEADVLEILWDAVGAASADDEPIMPLRRFYVMLDMMLAIEKSNA